MSTLRQIYELFRWEVKLEWRDKYAVGSILLYVVATVVLVYLGVGDGISGSLFNALFWIVVFFGATIATGRSFLRVGGRRHYYYYTLAGPLALLFSKMAFNVLMIWLICGLTFGLFSLFASADVIVAPLPFILAIFLGGIGLGAILTFVSAIAARAGGSGTLMAILSFPLVIPLLKVLLDAGQYAIDVGTNDYTQPILLAAALDLIAVAVGILLFPFVWRD